LNSRLLFFSNAYRGATPQQPMADAAADLRRRMKEQRAAIQRRFIDSRNWAAAASSAFSAALLEARSIANQTVSNRGISTSSPPLLFFYLFRLRPRSMV
jgi:hypothetical protein